MANGNVDFLSQPATDADRTGPNRLTVLDPTGVYLIGICGSASCKPPMLGFGLGGLISPSSCTIPAA